MLRDKILEDFKQARLAKDELKKSILLILKDAIEKKEKNENSNQPLDEVSLIQVISKTLKETNESLEFSKKAGNDLERTARFEKQIKILEEYLPQMMSEEEVKKVISEIITENSFEGKKDMGKVMKIAIPKLNGKADKTMVSKIVQSLL